MSRTTESEFRVKLASGEIRGLCGERSIRAIIQ
jgi:hypothetical protein